MSFNSINKAFENRFNVSKNILNEELRNKKVKANAKSKLLESVDKTLSERHWKFTIPGNYRNAIFDAADEEDFDSVRFALMDICQYVVDHIEESEEFDEESIEDIKDEYGDLLEELNYQDFEDEDECNYWLNELYDLMDNTDIFLGLRESLNESTDEVVVGLYGDEVDGIRSVSGLVQYFESKGLKVSNVSGDMDYGWELNVTGNPRTIFLAVQNLNIPGYMSDSVDDFISEYRIDALEESLWTDLVKKVPDLAEDINESSNSQKFWVLFFDENGYNPGGTDYAWAFNVLPKTIERKLKSNYFHLPKRATSYVILSDYQFRKMDYDDIHEYHQKYGKSLNEEVKEIFTITKIGNNLYGLAKGNPPVINSRKRIEASSAEEAKEILLHNGYKEDELVIDECLKEDTVKQNGKWVNRGKEGTHGSFKTKKEADAQRKAMFANGYKESLKENLSKKQVIDNCVSKLSKDSSLDKIRKTIKAEIQNISYPQDNDFNEIFDEVILKLNNHKGPFITRLNKVAKP